ncbi:hypothetical protein D3C81_2333410 [compost metagenome]
MAFSAPFATTTTPRILGLVVFTTSGLLFPDWFKMTASVDLLVSEMNRVSPLFPFSLVVC